MLDQSLGLPCATPYGAVMHVPPEEAAVRATPDGAASRNGDDAAGGAQVGKGVGGTCGRGAQGEPRHPPLEEDSGAARGRRAAAPVRSEDADLRGEEKGRPAALLGRWTGWAATTVRGGRPRQRRAG